MTNYSILVNSCDKYEEAWYPFFALLRSHWSTCSCPLYLNTENKTYSGFGCQTLNVNQKSWGLRLSECLDHIKTKYVICLLEDFFIQQNVNEEELIKCIGMMDDDPKIAVIYFNNISGYEAINASDNYYQMIPNEKNGGQYILNCQAALWRSDSLRKLAQMFDSPWQFEVEGYTRAKDIIDKMRFYCSRATKHDRIREGDVFPYMVERSTGYGIWGGKWLWNNRKLFEDNNIEVDMKLPIMSHTKYITGEMIENLIKKPLRPVINAIRKL